MRNRESGIQIYRDAVGFEVWIGLRDELAAGSISNAFIIGIGRTRADAVIRAVAQLEGLIELLEAPVGVVPEQDIRAVRGAGDCGDLVGEEP